MHNPFKYSNFLFLFKLLTYLGLASFLTLGISTKGSYNKKNQVKVKKEQIHKKGFQIYKLSSIKWEKIDFNKFSHQKTKWEMIDDDKYNSIIKKTNNEVIDDKTVKLSSFNRSIVFDEKIVGPDISWIVPPGLAWSANHKFDFSLRGHNRRGEGASFFGWNGGDAVSQIYFHPIHSEKNSYGLNLGVRSVYKGNRSGGVTNIGEGLSLGFRYDRELSNSAGMAIGAEQLLHFDGRTDTGRDIYITFTKGWWKNKDLNNPFPLYTATAGLATGKMAEGTLYGLCSDLFGGSGTEIRAQRPLCWAPVFSLAKVFNESFSTFFEYNSFWFLLGTSYVPFKSIPLRGTFAVQISDHINNYEVNNFENLKWVFRLSLGF